jgi:glycosyltransferase involved in cell wall biosynthesis
MVRLFFLIRSLDRGGAERQLVELVKGLDKKRFAITVCTFYDGGALRPELECIKEIRVVSLHKKGRWDLWPFLWRLWKTVRRSRPQILHGYLDMANVFSLLVGRLVGAKVVWGLRASNMDLSQYDWTFRWAFRMEAGLSRFPDLIIVNSQAGKEHHIAHGYCRKHMTVIPNGIDTQRFRPDREAGQRVRVEWGISDSQFLIGLVGRLDPMKDHPTFLSAAALLAKERNDVRFVCVGGGPEPYTQKMHKLAEDLGLGESLIWAGPRDDMPEVYNALDLLLLSSSYGEGFPNVVAEAMACGVPCVVTEVGDSALAVRETGVVVPPKDPQALAEGLKKLIARSPAERAALGQAARARIVSEYSRARLVGRTEEALQKLLEASGPSIAPSD